MKKYEFTDHSGFMYVGKADEIKSLYKALFRASEKIISGCHCYKSNILPMYCVFPKFNFNRHYGLVIEDGKMLVVNESVFVDNLLNGLLVEIK